MKTSFHLGKLMGIPIRIHISWLVIFLLLTTSLARYVFPDLYPDWSQATYWLIGLVTSLLFFASLLTHEMAHSLIAVKRGIGVRSITLFIFGGAARISREASSAGTELLMAIAGPLTSVLLSALFAVIWLVTNDFLEPIAAMSFYLSWINLALAAFNMLPGFPLDGGRVLRSIIWWRSKSYMRATRLATLSGQVFGYLLILFGAIIAVLQSWLSGLWLAFIGMFLIIAASTSYQQAKLRESLQDFTAQSLMTPGCQRVPASLSLESVVKDYLLPGGYQCLLVSDWGNFVGVITPQELQRIPRKSWSTTTVSQAMIPVERLGTVSPSDNGITVLERMDEGDYGLLLVKTDYTVVGVIERLRLLQLSRLHSDLGM
ncbi:MAG: site-2 protease family protein [Chloroflexota bacterium]|nr:site-2 protease family protein [Chloroflexota bacterium]